jgi:hypothetical protein
LIGLLPVLAGGAIGVIGSVCGGLVAQVLKVRTDARTQQRDKLERMLILAYEARQWIQTNSVAALHGLERDERTIPTAEMRMITLLYLPDLEHEVFDLNNHIVSYRLWAMEQGYIRKQQGTLTDGVLREHQNRSLKVVDLIAAVERARFLILMENSYGKYSEESPHP